MVKRNVKRKVKNIALLSLLVILTLAFVAIGIWSFKSINIPIFERFNKENIIRPIGKNVTVSDLKSKFDEKNIIFDSLKDASTSGVIIGQMRDGPLVYFSKNKDLVWQVSSLQLIISRLTIDSKKPTVVDLRGARPIVKF